MSGAETDTTGGAEETAGRNGLDDEHEELVEALHDVLLTLGERLNDQRLAEARVLLAESWTEQVALGLLEAAIETRVPLFAAERDLLALALRDGQAEQDLVAAVEVDDGLVLPSLTAVGPQGPPSAVDDALVLALEVDGRCRGAWRAIMRAGDGRIRSMWMVEIDADDSADPGLARMAARLNNVLVAASVIDPVIDVVEADGWLPLRAAAVRSAGIRLWPRGAQD